MVKKWIKIRGNALVRARVDTVKKGQFEKQKQNKKIISKIGEGSLRKQLSVEEQICCKKEDSYVVICSLC